MGSPGAIDRDPGGHRVLVTHKPSGERESVERFALGDRMEDRRDPGLDRIAGGEEKLSSLMDPGRPRVGRSAFLHHQRRRQAGHFLTQRCEFLMRLGQCGND